MTPALARRNESVPETAEDAAARFRCCAYLCTMTGTYCRDQHVAATVSKSPQRDACIDCPAGAARARLLGHGSAQGYSAPTCRGKTTRGRRCENPPVENGLCRICRKKETSMPPKRKAKATPDAPPVTAATCAREGCARAARGPGKILAEWCDKCDDTAYQSIKKKTGASPTPGQREDWLRANPVQSKRGKASEAEQPELAQPAGEVVHPLAPFEVNSDTVKWPSITASFGKPEFVLSFAIPQATLDHLNRLADGGMHGTDPADVARNLIFSGLRRETAARLLGRDAASKP